MVPLAVWNIVYRVEVVSYQLFQTDFCWVCEYPTAENGQWGRFNLAQMFVLIWLFLLILTACFLAFKVRRMIANSWCIYMLLLLLLDKGCKQQMVWNHSNCLCELVSVLMKCSIFLFNNALVTWLSLLLSWYLDYSWGMIIMTSHFISMFPLSCLVQPLPWSPSSFPSS